MIPSITFVHLPSAGWIFLILAGTAILLTFLYFRFSVPSTPGLRIGLGLLRALLLLILLIIIFDPYRSNIRPNSWVGVLVDTSSSMSVRDGTDGKTRLEQVSDYFALDDFWKEFKEKRVQKIITFDSERQERTAFEGLEAEGKASKLITVLEEINQEYREDPNLLGWIVFSDGAATDFDEKKTQNFEQFFFPWIAIGLGENKEVPNLQMLSPVLQEHVFVGEIIPLTVSWQSTMDPEESVQISIHANGEPYLQRQVRAGDQKAQFEVMVEEPGSHVFDIQIDPLEGEGSKDDNSARVWLEAHPNQIKVFYSESFYKKDNLLKRAIETDADFVVDFASSLIGFSRERKVPFIQDSLYGLPQTREELLDYDVIILSDVKRKLLSTDQIAWIKELVEDEGGAMVMIGGVDSFGDGGYVGTAIEDMLPVEISEEYNQDGFLAARGTVENPFRPMVVTGTEKHPLIQLTADEQRNAVLWDQMPLLGGYNYVGRLKPGATVLLEHPLDVSTFGPRIILALQSFGRGKALAFTSDVTHNWGQWFQDWRDEEGEWLYGIFWRNAIKYLTENRTRRRVIPIEIKREPTFAETGQVMDLKLAIPDGIRKKEEPVLKLEIWKGDSQLLTKQFRATALESEIHWRINALEPGDYYLQAVITRKNKTPLSVKSPFAIQTSKIESRKLKAEPKILQELAQKTQGVYLPFADRSQLEEALETIKKVHISQHSTPFWNLPWIYLLLLIILCVDWLIRKKKALE